MLVVEAIIAILNMLIEKATQRFDTYNIDRPEFQIV